MLKNLERLCAINGISGRETAVADEIERQIASYCDCRRDSLGNLIAEKKGVKRAKHKLMLSAHMDEVGLIVTDITADGLLRIAPVGGVDPRVVLGRSVTVGEGLPGVIGTKAMHMQSAEERGTAVGFDQLYIDIGAKNREDAAQVVSRGESVCFDSPFLTFGDGFVKGKAIDDRFGCALLIELIRTELPFDATFVFCTQEEIGLRGAAAAAYSVNPEFAIVCETTTAADLPDVPTGQRVCLLGEGAVVSFMDHRTMYDRELYRLTFKTAEEQQIKCQTKTMIAGGNDAGAIHVSRGGVRTMAVAIPCRYLHSPSCVIKKADMDSCLALVRAMAEKIQAL